MKTFSAKEQDVEKSWYVADADGAILGRLAVRVATVLLGKHKPIYTPHCDTGDFVIVTNAAKVQVSGNKRDTKEYYSYSGYPGGLKSMTFAMKIERKPEEIIRRAVWGMMPKNKLSRRMMKKLKVYAGAEHPHEAQQPKVLKI